ncbi:MAG: glutamine amidotransferase, partial [Planctomycetota bacterium]
SIDFKESRSYPLLVLGDYGLGRTAAFASDVAPHWVGPFVDWGNKRIKARADGSQTIEVGNWYAEFFANVLQWLCVKNYETINLI